MKKILISALLGALCISSFSTLTVKADVLTGGEEIVSEIIGDGDRAYISDSNNGMTNYNRLYTTGYYSLGRSTQARGVVW